MFHFFGRIFDVLHLLSEQIFCATLMLQQATTQELECWCCYDGGFINVFVSSVTKHLKDNRINQINILKGTDKV